MARLLQRLGSFSVRRRRLVLGGWLLALVALAGLAGAFKGTFSDEFKVPGTESQEAIELIQRNVPQRATRTAPSAAWSSPRRTARR